LADGHHTEAHGPDVAHLGTSPSPPPTTSPRHPPEPRSGEQPRRGIGEDRRIEHPPVRPRISLHGTQQARNAAPVASGVMIRDAGVDSLRRPAGMMSTPNLIGLVKASARPDLGGADSGGCHGRPTQPSTRSAEMAWRIRIVP